MSQNQLHGKSFELEVLGCWGVDASNSKATDAFDVPYGVLSPKSAGNVKMAKGSLAQENTTIWLSDATRIWTMFDMLKMRYREATPSVTLIIGLYSQTESEKEINTILTQELIFSEEAKACLYGSITTEEIRALSETMKPAFHKSLRAAKKYAHDMKQELHSKGGIIKLNPKLGSSGQRRLQCSVSLKDLIDNAEVLGATCEYTSEYMGKSLPWMIESSKRERKSK